MKIGLVLEGGALRTVYSSGVLDYYIEKGLTFDYNVGVSAGVAYAIYYFSGQKGANLQSILDYVDDKRYMGVRHWLNPKNRAFFNMDFVYDYIPNQIMNFDYDTYQAYPGKIEAGLTDIETGKVHWYEPDRTDRTHYLMRATCALPIMFPIFDYDGKKMQDGGVVDSIPWKRAFEQGCDKVVVILTREPTYVRGQESAIKLIRSSFKKYPEYLSLIESRPERYNKNHAELLRAAEEGKVFLYTPKCTQGFSRTEKDKEKIKALYQNGYDDAAQRWDELMAYLERE